MAQTNPFPIWILLSDEVKIMNDIFTQMLIILTDLKSTYVYLECVHWDTSGPFY